MSMDEIDVMFNRITFDPRIMGGGEPVPDHLQFVGVIEQWFDSVSDAVRAYTTWGYLRNIRADEPDFIDSLHCPFTAVKERVMFTDSSRPGR